MKVKSMRISRKGQVTLPRDIRKILGTDLVTYEVVDGQVLLLPVRDVSGSLHEYAAGKKEAESFAAQRSKAWEKAVRDKAGRTDT